MLTKVRRDVFPEPLGPTKRIEGNVVRPLLRKTTECRKMGMDTAKSIAMARPRGDGFSRVLIKFCIADMIIARLGSVSRL
jgi:hypothetical protein